MNLSGELNSLTSGSKVGVGKHEAIYIVKYIVIFCLFLLKENTMV